MPEFRYIGSGGYRSRPTGDMTPGDTAPVPDSDAAHFEARDDFEVVSAAESGGPSGEDTAEAPFDPGEKTVDELRDELDGSYSDAEREALANAEARGENRDTAIEVLAP